MKFAFKKIQFLLLGFGFIAFNSLHAQVSTPSSVNRSNMRDGEDVEYCITHKVMESLKQQPGFAQQFALDQQEMKLKEQELKNQTPKRVVYKIPIVFHILHNGGDENISNEQIFDAVRILNRDFRLQNEDALLVHDDFKASNVNATCKPADIEVEFVLATKAPNGACFNGITRTQSTMTSIAENSNQGYQQVNAIRTGNNVYQGDWPGNKYLNIFICKSVGGAAGYTMLPGNWSANAMTNGIWILSTYIGSIGTGVETRSRALTHEIGHWLNLDHTWGPNNNPGNPSSCSSDDGVADTPNTIGVTACNLNENSCGPRANVENYMDYSYCSKMFSEGQRDRMRAALAVSSTGRANLWTSANLVATGADGNATLCKVDFKVDKGSYCAGSEVQYSDASFNNVTEWSWSFPGGTPSTSNLQNPVVTYATPGVYSATLTASAGATSLTETKTSIVKVVESNMVLPYFEGFESYNATTDISNAEIANSSPTSAAFDISNESAATGSKSLKLKNFSQTGTNTDEFISPSINLSGVTSGNGGATLSFKYAYAKKASANNEAIKVYLTKNCGETWELRRTIQGSALTTRVVSTEYTAAQADFVTVHVTNVTSAYFVNNFRFKIQLDASGGNNLFLDDINLYRGGPSNENVMSVDNVTDLGAFNLYPNPADNEVNLSFDLKIAQALDLTVTDITGKVIQTSAINANSGANLVMINTSEFASGIYLVKIGGKVKQFVVK